MKRSTIFTLILFVFAGILYVAAQQPQPPKPLKVELSLNEWQAVLQALPYAKTISASDATEISNKIVAQLQPQIKVDSAALKAEGTRGEKYPSDTTKHKKP